MFPRLKAGVTWLDLSHRFFWSRRHFRPAWQPSRLSLPLLECYSPPGLMGFFSSFPRVIMTGSPPFIFCFGRFVSRPFTNMLVAKLRHLEPKTFSLRMRHWFLRSPEAHLSPPPPCCHFFLHRVSRFIGFFQIEDEDGRHFSSPTLDNSSTFLQRSALGLFASGSFGSFFIYFPCFSFFLRRKWVYPRLGAS